MPINYQQTSQKKKIKKNTKNTSSTLLPAWELAELAGPLLYPEVRELPHSSSLMHCHNHIQSSWSWSQFQWWGWNAVLPGNCSELLLFRCLLLQFLILRVKHMSVLLVPGHCNHHMCCLFHDHWHKKVSFLIFQNKLFFYSILSIKSWPHLISGRKGGFKRCTLSSEKMTHWCIRGFIGT